MIKRKIIFIVLLITTFGCQETRNNKDLERLKIENDSLKEIISNLDQKYIFDSISIRDIPSYQNTYRNNTTVSGEIVIVGYNYNEKTNVVLGDSIKYSPEVTIYNPDTLKLKDGGFIYNKKLEDSLHLRGIINVGNNYGKSHQAVYDAAINAEGI